MRPFTIEKPQRIEDAIAAAGNGGRYIAGGTTLVDLMREEVETPGHLIDINALPLADIRLDGTELVIGALARMAEIAEHPEVRRRQPVIAESLIEGASPQLRNMATIGGNLLQRARCPYFRMHDAACNKRTPGSGCSAIEGTNAGHAVLGASLHCAATHPSDVAVALVALDATLRVRGPQGERSLPVESLFRLPEDTPHLEHTLRPGELILEIRVPEGPHSRNARYLKVRDRASYEFAVVSVAAALSVDGGIIRRAYIAAGGVGTRPWRLRAVEAALLAKSASRETYEAAARRATLTATALSQNQYKIELLPRAVTRALELAGGGA